jgi:hypothetical protein
VLVVSAGLCTGAGVDRTLRQSLHIAAGNRQRSAAVQGTLAYGDFKC